MMLDLQPIKARLAAATPGPWSIDVTYFVPRSIWARVGKLFSADDATFADCDLIAHAPTDLAALVAEVERLQADVQLYKGRIEQHKEATARYGGPNSPDNRMLWEVLNDR